MNGQVGHPRPAVPSSEPSAVLPGAVVPGIAVLLAAVLLAGVALAALRSDTASAATVLVEGSGVTATLADGTVTTLAVGDEVPRGATVAATDDGAVLRTRDRDVLLGRDGQVTVVDGARQVLQAGFVMVDARRGPGLDVETAAAVVTTPGGAVSRIEPGPLLRVGAFAGDALAVRAVGRGATVEVERLYQVQVPVGGLPSRVTPLALTGDAYEYRLAGDLLAADRALTDLGRALDSAGDQGPAVLSALRTALPSVAAGDPVVRAAGSVEVGDRTAVASATPRSEPGLAFLLAAAPAAQEGELSLLPGDARLADRYAETRALRAAGGSWGVVARLVESSVPAVGSLLDRLLAPFVLVAGGVPAPPDLLSLLVAPGEAAGPGPVTGDPAVPGIAPADPSTPAPARPGPGAPPPREPPPPGPGPVPPPPEDPVGTVVDTVEVVVETVIGLLPEPPAPGQPAPEQPAPEQPTPEQLVPEQPTTAPPAPGTGPSTVSGPDDPPLPD